MKKSIFILIMILSNSIYADTPEIVKFAFEKLNADSAFIYGYTKSVHNNKEDRIMQHNPSLDGSDCWELISINGKAPNKKELKAFYKEMAPPKDGDENMALSSDDMDNFQIISETDNLVKYKFKNNTKKNKKMMEKLTCFLSINKVDSSISYIEMGIDKPISPMVSVTLNEFNIQMSFDVLPKTGANILTQTKTRIKGKAFLFKEINENVTEKYYDYKLIK